MDGFGWVSLERWLERRRQLPVGALFCILHGASRGRPWSAPAVCGELRCAAEHAGVRRRLAPPQLRHLAGDRVPTSWGAFGCDLQGVVLE